MQQKRSFRHASKHSRRLECRLRNAAGSGKPGRVRHLLREYLVSYDCKYTAVEQSYRDLKPNRRPDEIKLPEIARGLDAWEGTQEKVIVDFKEKSDGNYRPICRFGIRNKALQILADSALRCVAETADCQYALRGGRDAAINDVIDSLKLGYAWTIEFDLKDFYGSLDPEAVKGTLPLPGRVIERVILGRDLSLHTGNAYSFYGPALTAEEKAVVDQLDEVKAGKAAVRQGVAQGAVTSPLVAELMLSEVLSELPGNGRVISYADNILVAAKDENDCHSLSTALCQKLEQSPVGLLCPYINGHAKPGERFGFLGYRLAARPEGILIEPSEKNLAKFSFKTERLIEKIGDTTKSKSRRLKATEDLRRYTSGWCGSFRHWPGAALENTRIKKLIKSETASIQATHKSSGSNPSK